MSELSNSDGRLNLVQALDSLSANSDCACAFEDEKEKGKGGKKDKALPSVQEACVHHQRRGNNAGHA